MADFAGHAIIVRVYADEKTSWTNKNGTYFIGLTTEIQYNTDFVLVIVGKTSRQ